MRKGRLAVGLVASLAVVAAMWGAILGLGLEPQLGLDLRGGVSITLIPAEGQGEIDEAVLDQTVQVIRQRIDAIGVAEPDIARQGETVMVQLPGVADREQAEEVIGRTAVLQFRRVLEVIPFGAENYPETGESCAAAQDGVPPADEEVVLCERAFGPATGPGEQPEPLPAGQWTKYRLGEVIVSGDDVTDARAAVDPSGISWHVELELDRDGADAFEEVTGQLACEPADSVLRQMAIVLDGVVESAPGVASDVACGQGIGGGEAIITTGGGREDAQELAVVLRTGALPIELEFAQSSSVSPTLGEASLRAGLLAGLIGLILVAVYMTALYRGMGLAAVAELVVFGLLVYGMVIVLGEWIGFTLTLAGIAGIIVSVGIAADSSIIYRERYRDEIRAGRTVRTAAEHAFSKAWRTNLTGNTVSFLAAAVLYVLAVGPVRGFAFTLGLSTLIDTIVFGTFTRSLFGLIARSPKLARSPWVGLRAETVAPDIVAAATARSASGKGGTR
ncbi:MAG TPA: protein translocase subunit SecD [Egibacteraceae bacterium]|nr:protein translocase subunit SecD [Egibacteraceae bacterium]